MVSSTDTSLTKIEVFRSGLTSLSSRILMPLVRDSASNTILRLASRNCRVTGLVNFALSEGSAIASLAACSSICRCNSSALPFFGFSSKTGLRAARAASRSRFLSRVSACGYRHIVALVHGQRLQSQLGPAVARVNAQNAFVDGLRSS